jgi:prepilin-type N-terminal cleavage/methylation domain-containing protein
MKNKKGFTQHHKNGAGFTLIELLIVVAIIGILAAALLIAINPIEQINKARDGGAVSKGKEFINACERYYASYADYPANCDVLEGTTVQEVKSGFCLAATSGTPSLTLTAADCTASFTPMSEFYKTNCGLTCNIPAGLSGL